MLHLAILGSTRGTDMQAIINAIQKKQLNAVINIVISNKPDAYILERAKQNNLPAIFMDPKDASREEYDEKIMKILRENAIDLVVLIGYMRILSKTFVTQWQKKIMNVHPSLLPAFAGGMDGNVHQAVLDSGVKETGCTVHLVTEAVDAGPILIQKKCPVFEDDTVDTLKNRVQNLEGDALVEAISLLSTQMREDNESA
jgi:phosphoribosylglycinamide formyltransferase-1